jgi:hypothetical protein
MEIRPGALLSRLKNHLVVPGAQPRTISTGAFRGLCMEMDLRDRAQVFLGLYERELHPWVRSLGRDAATAIDVGAADGAYSLYFLKRTGVKAVYAFEADGTALEQFHTNLRLNDVADDVRLHVMGASVGSGSGRTVALDSLADRIETPCVVKVDVEGSEVDVLEGATALLERRGVSWIIETHAADLEAGCVRLLTRRGLTVRIVSPAWWRFAVPERRPLPHNRWLVAAERAFFE